MPPDLHALTDGGWVAICVRCLGRSDTIAPADAAGAWSALESVGWSTHEYAATKTAYAICPACIASPKSFADRVSAVMAKWTRK
jgi:hypothetical protein